MTIQHIKALPMNITQQMLNQLHESKYTFYLTGSRFFNPETANINTDYDFFVDHQDKDETGVCCVDQFLYSLGFTEESDMLTYNDPYIIDIYYHKAANIHIQVVKNSEVKNRIQRIMKLYPDLTYRLTKKQKQELWNMLFKVHDTALPFANEYGRQN